MLKHLYPCFGETAEGREIYYLKLKATKSNAKKSAVLLCYLSFFSCLSEKISFLFACFPKYLHLCNAI